jgi:hypothetical protein
MFKMKKLKDILLLNKEKGSITPKTKDNSSYVGIEIECILPFKDAKLALSILLAEQNLTNKVRIGTDESITGLRINDLPLEIRILDKQSQIYSTVFKVCTILRKLKAKVNKSCGLHVHLDMRQRSFIEKEKIYNNFLKSQNLLFSLVKKERLRNKYCKKIHKKVYIKAKTKYIHDGRQYVLIDIPASTIKPLFTNMLVNDDRRFGINVRSLYEHNTIEIRIHHGTLSFKEISNWIRILLKIAKKDNIVNELPKGKTGLKIIEKWS